MDAKGNFSTRTTMSARIICCGHRSFFSPKSGLLFPALLIQFAEDFQTDDSTTGQQHTVYRYQWRSKRDFLILKRSTASTPNFSFPKSAFSNLCDQALKKPWLRPLNQADFETEKEIILSKLDLYDSDPEAYGYHPRMIKSIARLEKFLENHTDCGNAWAIFSRNEDGSGIINPGDRPITSCEDDATRRAVKLSQYFTSANDAKMVRDELMPSDQSYFFSSLTNIEYQILIDLAVIGD